MNKRKRERIILFKIKAGQTEAFAELYDMYSKQIYRYIYFKVPTKERAEDLSGDVFLKSWEYMNKHNNTVKNFQAFIYQIARNLIADFYKKNKELPLEYAENSSAIEDHSFQKRIEDISDWQVLEGALRKLGQINEKWQEVLVLRYVEDLTTKEIAKVMNESHSNVRVLLHRALDRLKEIARG
jgi:RNA polymerase sigma-70 factor, ECF subfamily